MKLDMQLESKEVARKELRIHRTRQGEKGRAIKRAKVYMLIVLAILCHVWNVVPMLERLRSVYIKADFVNGIEVKYSSNSMIRPMLREEASIIGLMHNKRFFSPEIKIDYYTEVSRNTKGKIEITQNRDYMLDRVHNTLLYKGELLKYKQAYFNTLLEMFPSLYGYVSIWSGRKDSFFSFINSTAVEKYKYKILASLLLLAEGIDMPLKIYEGQNGAELVLRTADEQGEHFRVSMNVLVSISKEDAGCTDVHEKMPERGAVSVVKFFIENRENPVLKEEKYISKIANCDQRETCKFVNSPGFLIQMYIRYCLGSADKMNLFIQIVNGMIREYIDQSKENIKDALVEKAAGYLLSDYIQHEKAKLKDEQAEQAHASQTEGVFPRDLVPEEQRLDDPQPIDATHPSKALLSNDFLDYGEDLLHLEPVAYMVPTKKNIHSLRILSSITLDADLPDGKPIQKNDVLTGLSVFIDYGETSLLGLFCWALYNCEENIYTVDHIESASEELRSFFRKHKNMYGVVSKGMHDDWNQVVGDLSDPNIQYMRPDRNQLVPGIINMLYVIKEITGIGDTEKLDGFRERLEWIEEEQKIEEVKKQYEMMREFYYMDQVYEIENLIRYMINEKELRRKKMLEEKLECVGEVAAHRIELETQKLDNMMEERKKMNIHALYKSYSEQRNVLKAELNQYLSEFVKKISLSTNINISIDTWSIQTLKERFIDVFGRIKILYNRDDKEKENAHLEHPYCYDFLVCPDYYNNDTAEIEYKTHFKIHIENSTQMEVEPQGVERNSSFIDMLEIKRENGTLINKLAPTILFDYEWCRDIDLFLLIPLVNIPEFKRSLVLQLLLYAKEQNLGKNHHIVRLAGNIMESAHFMYKDDKNSMLMVLDFIPLDKYYPHIAINEHIP